jgi:hypothetical protein
MIRRPFLSDFGEMTVKKVVTTMTGEGRNPLKAHFN